MGLTVQDLAEKLYKANPKYDYRYLVSSGKGLGDTIASRSLTGQMREYVIKQVKDPLRKVLVMVMKRKAKQLGLVTKENSVLHNTHVLLDIREKFFLHYINNCRKEMLEAALELVPFEHEHDSHYRWLFYWWLKEIIKEIEAGNFILPENEPFPDPESWKE